MKTKIIMLLAVLTLLASCGSDSGSPQSPGTGVSGGNGQGTKEDPKVESEEVANCGVSFARNDRPALTAVKAHRARVECKLTEDEIVKMVGKAHS